jgi:hypothetical protein
MYRVLSGYSGEGCWSVRVGGRWRRGALSLDIGQVRRDGMRLSGANRDIGLGG